MTQFKVGDLVRLNPFADYDHLCIEKNKLTDEFKKVLSIVSIEEGYVTLDTEKPFFFTEGCLTQVSEFSDETNDYVEAGMGHLKFFEYIDIMTLEEFEEFIEIWISVKDEDQKKIFEDILFKREKAIKKGRE